MGSVVGLFILYKILQRLALGDIRAPINWLDIVALAVLGLVVGLVLAIGSQRRRETRGAEERRPTALESLALENEAALRVTRAIVRELSQPLSGVLSYSEFMMMRAEHVAGCDRQELDGLREGVLQMERLLADLRQTIAVPLSTATQRRVADDIERCVTLPRPRVHTYTPVACADPNMESGIA